MNIQMQIEMTFYYVGGVWLNAFVNTYTAPTYTVDTKSKGHMR
jgi:hypothetical protein